MSIVKTLSHQAGIIRNKSEWYQIGEDKIEIKPLTVGQLIAIDPYISQIQLDEEIKTPEDFFEKLSGRLKEYMEPIKAIFTELIDYDIGKMIPNDIVNLLVIIIHQMDTKSFQESITLIKKVSRNSREIIALASKEEKNYLTQ